MKRRVLDYFLLSFNGFSRICTISVFRSRYKAANFFAILLPFTEPVGYHIKINKRHALVPISCIYILNNVINPVN